MFSRDLSRAPFSLVILAPDTPRPRLSLLQALVQNVLDGFRKEIEYVTSTAWRYCETLHMNWASHVIDDETAHGRCAGDEFILK